MKIHSPDLKVEERLIKKDCSNQVLFMTRENDIVGGWQSSS
jgi:hypothetical protein